jgi:hypothetical protein
MQCSSWQKGESEFSKKGMRGAETLCGWRMRHFQRWRSETLHFSPSALPYMSVRGWGEVGMLDEKCCSHWFFLFDLALECLKILANNLVILLKNIKKMAVSKLMDHI